LELQLEPITFSRKEAELALKLIATLDKGNVATLEGGQIGVQLYQKVKKKGARRKSLSVIIINEQNQEGCLNSSAGRLQAIEKVKIYSFMPGRGR
jgi:hypothetical protein